MAVARADGIRTRGGWHSYDLFDNAGRPSAERILPEYQQPKVGDWVPMARRVDETTAFRVGGLGAEPLAAVGEAAHSTWAWNLAALEGGKTRVTARLKDAHSWRDSPGNALLSLVLFEFGDFPMMRKLLLGVKRRAEGTRSGS